MQICCYSYLDIYLSGYIYWISLAFFTDFRLLKSFIIIDDLVIALYSKINLTNVLAMCWMAIRKYLRVEKEHDSYPLT